MYWLDIAIIYFALGAPFGVLRITAKRAITPFAYLRMASGYLLWPLVAIRNVARFVFTKPAAQKDKLDTVRTELEKNLFAHADPTDLYAFREAFYRYAGLAEAVNAQRTVQNAQSSGFHSPFTIHHSPLTRAACIARRDRLKLKAQLDAARIDFVEEITSKKTNEGGQSGVALAEYFADSVLIDLFHSR